MSIEGEKLLTEVGTKKSTKKRTSSTFVLDNGSCVFRFGTSAGDSPDLCFASVVHKGQPRGSSTATEVLFGGEESELAQFSRFSSKTAFDQNIVVNFDVLEMELDHAIQHLQTAPSSFVMTEALGSFEGTRAATNELLFDAYGCKKVAYGIDSLFSYFVNNDKPDGLIVSIGNRCTHVIPLVEGRAQLANAKRLNIGGFHMQEFMLKSLQLKYPTFPYKLSFAEASLFTYSHCHFSSAYDDELLRLLNEGGHQQDCSDENNAKHDAKFVQFPVPETAASPSQQDVEEQQRQEAERKKEFAQKMREQAVEKRKERLEKYEIEMQEFIKLYHMEKTDPTAFKTTLEYLEFEDKQDLLNAIVKTRESINGMRQKMDLEPLEFDEDFDKSKETTFNWDLLNVSDDELDEDEVKEKRRLRIIKASMDAKEKLKKQKELLQQKEKEEAELKARDFASWLALMHSKRNAIRSQLAIPDASKEKTVDRMRKMASMIDTEEETKAPSAKGTAKKAKKAKRAKHAEGETGEDSFGAQDADWAVYQDIQVNEQLDENLQEELERIEELLLANDPNFSPAVEKIAFNLENSKLFCNFLHGKPSESIVAEDYYRLYLNVEQIRVPEIIFQPPMAGVDQCGLAELITQTILSLPSKTGERLAQNIFVCGSPCRIPGLQSRLQAEIRSCLPEDWELSISIESDPLSAWKGAAKWARENESMQDSWITDKNDAAPKYCLYA